MAQLELRRRHATSVGAATRKGIRTVAQPSIGARIPEEVVNV